MIDITLSMLGIFFSKLQVLINTIKSTYFQRLYRSKLKYLGNGVLFHGVSKIYGLENIEIGNNVHIGENAYINGAGGLKIGDNTHISRNLVLYTQSHEYEGSCLPYDDKFRKRHVSIGKNVWVGMNVVILPGSKISDGVIVGAGAVVAGYLEPLSIYGAAKATKIGVRDKARYERLEKQKKYGGASGAVINK